MVDKYHISELVSKVDRDLLRNVKKRPSFEAPFENVHFPVVARSSAF
jgi:hypothetical protein